MKNDLERYQEAVTGKLSREIWDLDDEVVKERRRQDAKRDPLETLKGKTHEPKYTHTREDVLDAKRDAFYEALGLLKETEIPCGEVEGSVITKRMVGTVVVEGAQVAIGDFCGDDELNDHVIITSGIGDGVYEVTTRSVVLPVWGERVASAEITFLSDNSIRDLIKPENPPDNGNTAGQNSHEEEQDGITTEGH
jgi:hypothetical protein